MKLNKVECVMRRIAMDTYNHRLHGLPYKWYNCDQNKQACQYEDGSIAFYHLTTNIIGEPAIEETINGEPSPGLFLLSWYRK